MEDPLEITVEISPESSEEVLPVISIVVSPRIPILVQPGILVFPLRIPVEILQGILLGFSLEMPESCSRNSSRSSFGISSRSFPGNYSTSSLGNS